MSSISDLFKECDEKTITCLLKMKTFPMLKTVYWKNVDKKNQKISGTNFIYFVIIKKKKNSPFYYILDFFLVLFTDQSYYYNNIGCFVKYSK